MVVVPYVFEGLVLLYAWAPDGTNTPPAGRPTLAAGLGAPLCAPSVPWAPLAAVRPGGRARVRGLGCRGWRAAHEAGPERVQGGVQDVGPAPPLQCLAGGLDGRAARRP